VAGLISLACSRGGSRHAGMRSVTSPIPRHRSRCVPCGKTTPDAAGAWSSARARMAPAPTSLRSPTSATSAASR
jgi:hypothetical protein